MYWGDLMRFSDEYEENRHRGLLARINEATSIDELRKIINFSDISKYLSTNIKINDKKLSQADYKTFTDELMKYGSMTNDNVKKAFFDVISHGYENVDPIYVLSLYETFANGKRIGNILTEIYAKDQKMESIIRDNNKKEHEEKMRDIQNAFEIFELPKVGFGDLNKKLVRAINLNAFKNDFKTGDIRELAALYLNGLSDGDLDYIVSKICNKTGLSLEEKEMMHEQIIDALKNDDTIAYVAEEIVAKEKRKEYIYKNDHELTMEAIKEAKRIAQLPSNLTESTLNNYLNGNTTIYSKDDRIMSEDLRVLTSLLLEGHKWEDEEIRDEINRIAARLYPDKDDASILLFDKLSDLPKTYYLVDEINYSKERQKEFIGRRASNVNIYFLPNDKSPREGGVFYNVYANYDSNLDLSELVPLNLEDLIPEGIDQDAIEWYIQEHYDPSFKTVGGLIFNKDEVPNTNINVYTKHDGGERISKDEKTKFDEIRDLDAQIESKKAQIAEMDSLIESKLRTVEKLNRRIDIMIDSAEKVWGALSDKISKDISGMRSEIKTYSREQSEERLDEILDDEYDNPVDKRGPIK